MLSNRNLIETQLEQLKKRFLKDPRCKKDYVAFVEKMVGEGHTEKAPSEYKTAWYIPHHGLNYPKKPEKRDVRPGARKRRTSRVLPLSMVG